MTININVLQGLFELSTLHIGYKVCVAMYCFYYIYNVLFLLHLISLFLLYLLGLTERETLKLIISKEFDLISNLR